MLKKILFICFLLPLLLIAQTITGKITDGNKVPLKGVRIGWLGFNEKQYTNTNGEFSISFLDSSVKVLIIDHDGYLGDTVVVSTKKPLEIQLIELNNIEAITINSRPKGVIISDNEAIKVEQITEIELGKSACCDLAGCFETQSTVQPQTTNVITNSKELRILGLSGVYNQLLIDGFPLIQGLTYTYGISSIPGTLVDNIYVSKGANSVLQGFESISGQINVETKEADQTDRLLVNAYLNSFMEKHVNANYAVIKGKWSNLTAIHTINPANKIDRDNDNFLDLPLLTRYMFYNKLKYGNEKQQGWHSRIAFRFVNENRIGGQKQFNALTDQGSSEIYGQTVSIIQPEVWTKTGFRINNQHHIVLFASFMHQNQNSFFGNVKYNALQSNFYSNLQYEFKYANNDLKTGVSFRHLNLKETITFLDTKLLRTYDGNYSRLENIPGIFAENTMRFFNEKLTWIAGIRGDEHNQFGIRFTPRTLLKYDLSPQTIIRGNWGTGWRTVNLFSENIGLLVSSRDIIFKETLQPESAVNTGINATHKFEIQSDISGYLSLDYYRTNFNNQIFPDYDSDPTKAIIQNFTGKSVSNGFQAELYLSFFNRIEFKSGYNYLDVYRVVNDNKQVLPFNPRHKLVTTLSYKPLSNQFHIDLNTHWYGKQRLPNTESNPVEFKRPDYSKPYLLANIQFTYSIKQVEIYSGCENIFDFRQLQPIISWQNPFGPYFDTSSVWGPTRGREIYVGIRVKLNQAE